MQAAPLIEMVGIRKAFPGVLASDGVALTVYPGEVLGLLGENGAGKSTLMKMLGGIYQPDAGEIRLDGRPVTIDGVTASQALGIAFIHQELNVVDNLDAAGNIFLGREPVRGFLRLVDRQRMQAEAAPILRQLGFDLPPTTPLSELSIAQQQLVEIAKALSLNARVLIMDEPTSSLTLAETERLMQQVLALRNRGVAIIYISHRLGEIKQLADRAVVLRDGKNSGELRREEIDHDRMVRLMVGRDIRSQYGGPQTGERTPGFFRANNVRSRRFPEKSVSLEAARGEILGIAGLVGSGRTELLEAIFCVDGPGRAEVEIAGQRLALAHCGDAVAQGLALVPEDRRQHGLITAMTVRENVSLARLRHLNRLGLVSSRQETGLAERARTELAIKSPTIDFPAANLSGGNQQKVVLGKWLATEPRVLFFDEPTRGIDVGAKAEIYRLMRDLSARGIVVIMVSSDMEEILQLSDRVAVMHEGRIAGVLERADCTEEKIMHLAVGGGSLAAPHIPSSHS